MTARQIPVLDCFDCPFFIRRPSLGERLRGRLHDLRSGHDVYDGPMGVSADPTGGAA